MSTFNSTLLIYSGQTLKLLDSEIILLFRNGLVSFPSPHAALQHEEKGNCELRIDFQA